MSTFGTVNKICAICGNTDEYHVIMSTNAFGSMDLDTRPPEMRRSTMPVWVQECPHCGYVSKDVGEKTSVTADFLRSEEYLSLNGITVKSKLAEKFIKYYMISVHDEKLQEAFNASLYAAWASDDAEDTETAKLCRCRCIELIPSIITEQNKTLIVIKADLLRRTGRFEELISEYEGMNFEEDLLQKIVAFQIAKAKEKDIAVYTVEDVVK